MRQGGEKTRGERQEKNKTSLLPLHYDLEIVLSGVTFQFLALHCLKNVRVLSHPGGLVLL